MLKDDLVVYICLEVVIACLAVTGNVLVCWAVSLNSNLQSITNFFVVSLALADIAVGLLAIPFAIAVSTGFCADFYGCLFICCFVLILTQSSIFSLLAIAVDRYIAIKNPLRYTSLVTGQRAKGIIALCWILSVVIGLTPMLGWNTASGNNTTSSSGTCPEGMTECLFEGVVTLDYMVYFNFFGCVLVPLFAMLVLYTNIFIVARRQLRLICLKIFQAPSGAESASSSSSSPSTLQKEVHAAKSLAIIVGLFAFCWLPVHLINCFNLLCEDCNRPSIWWMNIAIILSHANSVINPFIYAYRIREFRYTFRRILYQNILGRRDMPRVGVSRNSVTGIGSSHSSIVGTSSSRNSREALSCGTIVNSSILDSDPSHAPPNSTQDASGLWTIKLDPETSGCVPNGHKTKEQAAHLLSIPGYSVQERTDSVTDVDQQFELKDSLSSITFVNVHALSPNPTGSTELPEVS